MQLVQPRRFITLLAVTTSFLRLSLAANIPQAEQGSLYQPGYSTSDNTSTLLVTDAALNSSSDDADGTSLLSLYSANPNSQLYDVFPAGISNNNVQCDGSRYGVNIDRAACQDALQRIGTSPAIITVAQRGTGRRPQITLPNRYSSCKHTWILIQKPSRWARIPIVLSVAALGPSVLTSCKANGRCVIDIMIAATGITQELTSNNEIRQAATRVINGCVNQASGSRGGSLSSVGGFRNYLDDLVYIPVLKS